MSSREQDLAASLGGAGMEAGTSLPRRGPAGG